MSPQPQDLSQSGIAPPPRIIPSEEIVGHVDRALASLPPEAQAAVSHAHGLMGLQDPIGPGMTGGTAGPQAPVTPPSGPSVPPPYLSASGASGGDSPFAGIALPKPSDAEMVPAELPEHAAGFGVSPMAHHYRGYGFDVPTGADAYRPAIKPSAGSAPMTIAGDPGYTEGPVVAGVPPGEADTGPGSLEALPPRQDLPAGRSVSGRIAALESPQVSGPKVAPYVPPVSGQQAELQRLQKTGSGVSQIHNPFYKTLATIGDVISSGIYPGFGQFMPGTSAHHQMLVGNARAAEGDELARQKAEDESAGAEAARAHTEAETTALPVKTGAESKHLGAQSRLAETQADVLAEEGKQKPKDKYITVPGGGLFNAETRTWERQPTDKSQLYELSKEAAEEHKVKADDEGRYYIPVSAAGEILKTPVPKEGDDKEKFVTRYLKEHSLHDDATGRGQALAEYAKVSQAPQRAPIVNINAQDHQEQMHGKSLLDKAEGSYRAAAQSADSLANFVTAAKSGNKVAAEAIPLEGALNITTAQGVHRINRNEIDQVAGAGDIFDRIMGKVGKWTKGQPIPPGIQDDFTALSTILKKGAYKTYRDAYTSAVKRYGLKDEEPLAEPGGGAVDPKLKAFADEHFGGDIAKAQAEVEAQRKRKAGK